MTESVTGLWSMTAADNDDADGGINWVENMAPSAVNNSGRGMMAAIKKFANDIGGHLVSTGSTNEYTITTNQGIGAHANGVFVVFRADKTNTGAATTTIDGLAQKSILRADGTATVSGDIVSGGIYELRYSSVGGTGYLLSNVNPVANSVTAATTVTDNSIIRGDGTGRGIQTSVVAIDDTTGSLYPETTDSGSLGTTTKNWSDLFLDLGGVINFDSGDVTITHSANTLTFAGASSGYAFDVAPNVGGTSVVLTTDTATTSAAGVVEKATYAEVYAATADKFLAADHIETASALVALTETAGAVAVDWDTFVNGSVTVDQATAISNPTNGQPGTWRTILIQGNDTTDRTITFGNQFLGDVPTITDCDSGIWYRLTLWCVTTTHFTVDAKKVKG